MQTIVAEGGVSGTATAIALRRIGSDVTLYETHPNPRVAAHQPRKPAELHFGLLVATIAQQRAQRLQRLIAVERKFEPLPVDAGVARSYGQLAAAARAYGRKPQPRALDLMIAATAHANNARLVTRNADDLRGIEHLLDVDTL
ncbi:PIN domain-containing protein [Rhodococcus sp. NPDC127530]|uniref:type II toxin-antitoxin system VapC family toxin n=1 Tax=unclassified Rhodococcus (in: high G+C Gram-positive bacteria) TaxID=192944 RepID=UPI00363799C7